MNLDNKVQYPLYFFIFNADIKALSNISLFCIGYSTLYFIIEEFLDFILNIYLIYTRKN